MASLWSHNPDNLVTFYEMITGTQERNLTNNHFYVGIFEVIAGRGFVLGPFVVSWEVIDRHS